MGEHSPLSASLQAILEHPSSCEELTINLVLQRTEGRGLFLLMVLLCLPFVAPVSIPGLSFLMGSVVMFLAVRLALDLPPRLPGCIGARALPQEKMRKVLGASVRLLRVLEKLVKPRRSRWMRWRVTRIANALLIAFMAFLLALPFPPIPPFTNTFPSYAIILLALSMMEEDGVMVWVGYGAAIATTVYLGFTGDFIFRQLQKMIYLLGA